MSRPGDSYATILARLHAEDIRFVVIGVSGANYYAAAGQTLFATQDSDLFLPPDPENLVRCWAALEKAGWELWSLREPLDRPRDLWLAKQVIAREAAVTATHDEGLRIDLTLVMAGFRFEEVWPQRQLFEVGGSSFPVASLGQIVESKRAAGRPKDLLFLATHESILAEILKQDGR